MTDTELQVAESLKQYLADKYIEAKDRAVLMSLGMEQANILFRAVSYYIDRWKKIHHLGEEK